MAETVHKYNLGRMRRKAEVVKEYYQVLYDTGVKFIGEDFFRGNGGRDDLIIEWGREEIEFQYELMRPYITEQECDDWTQI